MPIKCLFLYICVCEHICRRKCSKVMSRKTVIHSLEKKGEIN